MSTETTEVTEAPVEKKVRVKRNPAELKAARVAKAEKALERVKNSGDKVVKRAAELAEKAAKAKAKADEHAEALVLAERNLAWERARPVRGETATGGSDEPFADADDLDEDETDLDEDFEDDIEDEDGDEDSDDDDL